MRPEDLHPAIDAAAPIAIACFVFFLRALKDALPFSVPWRFFAWGTVVAIGGYGLVTVATVSPDGFVGGLVGISFLVYVVRARIASAKAREIEADRLRQARGHERRRAAPPLPPGGGTR